LVVGNTIRNPAGHPLLKGCPVLVLDACSPKVLVGALGVKAGSPEWISLVESESGAVEQLFPAVESVLANSELPLSAFGGLMVCEGPGNLLGLRTAALAAETWRAAAINPGWQLWSYRSLALLQYCVRVDFPDLQNADVLFDWRRGHWFRCQLREGEWREADTLSAAEVKADSEITVFHVPGRGNWPAPPVPAQPCGYQPDRLCEWLASGMAEVAPVAQFEVRGEPLKEYVRWSGEPHGR
jgi:tRNA threonylcarbamoyladenosine biosynthesis protein TsaB